MPGPPPKQAPLSRPNDEARKRARYTTISPDGRAHGPELPTDRAWHPRTVAWWHTWRTSAQATRLQLTDWDFLLDTAVLHSAFWDGRAELAPELRLRVSKFGATMEDRARLRLDATGSQPEPAEPGEPTETRTAARRRRLLRAVADD